MRPKDAVPVCARCGQTDAAKFWRRQVYCKDCLRGMRKNDPVKIWAQGLKRRYGISPREFDLLLEKQGGSCAACGGPSTGKGLTFRVDHDHSTGRIRGLLCHGCNAAIGAAHDDPGLLRRLAIYLEE